MHHNAPNSLAVVLKLTAMPEVYVLLSAVLVAAVAIAALHQKAWPAAARKVFLCLCAVIVVGMVVPLVAAPGLARRISGEGHVFEWLSAHMLLAAAILGIVLTVRLALRNRPAPLAVFLTAGYSAAFCREIEWGEPFFGEKLWYSRFLFRPKALVDSACFAKQAQSVGLPPEYLHRVHIIFVAAIFLIGAAVIWYLIRHRHVFDRDLRQLPGTSCGRFFLLGMGIYVGTQILGRLVEYVLLSPLLADWSRTYAINNEVFDEPLELVGAMSFLLSMLALWHERLERGSYPKEQNHGRDQ